MEPITLTASDDGARVKPAPGQTVEIRLPENPTTGFCWQAPAGAVIVGDEFAAATSDAAGAAGERIFTLAADHEPATLRFELARPWEKDAPEQRFTMHVAPVEQG